MDIKCEVKCRDRKGCFLNTFIHLVVQKRRLSHCPSSTIEYNQKVIFKARILRSWDYFARQYCRIVLQLYSFIFYKLFLVKRWSQISWKAKKEGSFIVGLRSSLTRKKAWFIHSFIWSDFFIPGYYIVYVVYDLLFKK